MPVAGLMLIHSGRSSEVKARVSPSTSEKTVEALKGSWATPSVPVCGINVPVTTGASFAPVTVTVTVAISVPPSPSETV